MFQSYLKIGWRNITKSKVRSFINFSGLAAGMAVAIIIGLWIHDELSYEKNNKNYARIVQVLEHSNIGDGVSTEESLPMPVSAELRSKYGSDFTNVASTLTYEQNVVYGDKALAKIGCFAEPAFVDIITLNIKEGTQTSFKDRTSILLSESLAKALFGIDDPINKTIVLSNNYTQKVTGVYKDMPKNSRFSGVDFLAPIDLVFSSGAGYNDWRSSSFQIYALLAPHVHPRQLSAKIKNVLYENSKDATKPVLFLHPISRWHLYEFKNGQMVSGRMQFVWLFGIIGTFVLLLACINFMNLSTAESEKRAKEVGIRKTVGSLREQLIFQFLTESFLTVMLAFMFSMLIVTLSLPYFNDVANKQMSILWENRIFWLMVLGFIVLTSLVAGSYPAFYLSSFEPVKVLKGTFKVGRFAALPRKALVVFQFTFSIALVICTIVVFQQIQFAKNRPIGYNRNGLVTIPYTASVGEHYSAFRDELLRTGAVTGVSASSSPTTGVWSSADNLNWKGKDPNRQEMFGTILVDPDYGSLVEWQIKEGRNFSKELSTDSSGFIFNEAAIRQMNLKNPVGENVQWHEKNWKIIGVVKDMVMRSPFDPAAPTVFLMNDKERSFNVINIKINGGSAAADALKKIEIVFKKFAPATPFNYRFADQEYALKFAEEERVGQLGTLFAALAIFISCLGLFGLAAFIAEKRTREIGIRKVLGATVYNLWNLLSKEFVVLVFLSCVIAVPLAFYFQHQWLQKYEYRTSISWQVFAAAIAGALVITLLTVSFQAIKAAIANPVKSLRTE
jgi:ABC-type antimicrobial peptide transport system permease subunit